MLCGLTPSIKPGVWSCALSQVWRKVGRFGGSSRKTPRNLPLRKLQTHRNLPEPTGKPSGTHRLEQATHHPRHGGITHGLCQFMSHKIWVFSAPTPTPVQSTGESTHKNAEKTSVTYCIRFLFSKYRGIIKGRYRPVRSGVRLGLQTSQHPMRCEGTLMTNRAIDRPKR